MLGEGAEPRGLSRTVQGTEIPPLNTFESPASNQVRKAQKVDRRQAGGGALQALPCEEVQGWGNSPATWAAAPTPWDEPGSSLEQG